jgi:hypothetical protein
VYLSENPEIRRESKVSPKNYQEKSKVSTIMNLMKKVSLAIIASKYLPTPLLLDYCAGRRRLNWKSKLENLVACCNTIQNGDSI